MKEKTFKSTSLTDDIKRTIGLTLFVIWYSLVAMLTMLFLPHELNDWFPRMSYLSTRVFIVLLLMIPATIVILTLIRTFNQWKKGLYIQLIGYGCIAILFLCIGLLNPGTMLVAFLLFIGIAFVIIFAFQLIVIGIRGLVHKILSNPKKERTFGYALLIATLLLMLPLLFF